jgi:hypothetical protein
MVLKTNYSELSFYDFKTRFSALVKICFFTTYAAFHEYLFYIFISILNVACCYIVFILVAGLFLVIFGLLGTYGLFDCSFALPSIFK